MSVFVVDTVLSMVHIDRQVFDQKSLKSREDLGAEITGREVKFFAHPTKPDMCVRDARGVSLLALVEGGGYYLETGRWYLKNGVWIHRPKLKPQTATETLVRMPHVGGQPDRFEPIPVAAPRCGAEELELEGNTEIQYFTPKNAYPFFDIRKSNVYYQTESWSIRSYHGLLVPQGFWGPRKTFQDSPKVRLDIEYFADWPFEYPPFQIPPPTKYPTDWFATDHNVESLLHGLNFS